MPVDWGAHYLTCDHCGTRYHASEGGCGCQDDCKAYKPWTKGVWRRDGQLQEPCRACPDLGECQWSTPEDATDWGEMEDARRKEEGVTACEECDHRLAMTPHGTHPDCAYCTHNVPTDKQPKEMSDDTTTTDNRDHDPTLAPTQS